MLSPTNTLDCSGLIHFSPECLWTNNNVIYFGGGGVKNTSDGFSTLR